MTEVAEAPLSQEMLESSVCKHILPNKLNKVHYSLHSLCLEEKLVYLCG